MAKLVTISVNGTQRPGAIKDSRVLELGGEGDLMAIIEGGPAALDDVRAKIAAWDGPDHALEAVTLRAPVARPNKIIGIGLNYLDHCREAGLDVPKFPVVFTKYSTSVSGPYDDVVWHTNVCQEVDYEVELGVVIGRPAFQVDEQSALDYVFGYTTVNDVSARDLQLRPPGQWDLGKSLDTFCPYGPGIVTTDEIPDPQTLDLNLRVNGEEKQRSNTTNMVFGVANLIAFLSQGITLLPGDLIATGTPFGTGLGMKPPVYLNDGDVCEAEVQGIGVIRNRIRAVSLQGD
jgi:2-keto-4-pentenoate hydratase/2-oxohepta-3-ene-1,7-dioic acid hydratase in catechol pathway